EHSPSYHLVYTDPPTAEVYTLSLHDALPICGWQRPAHGRFQLRSGPAGWRTDRRSAPHGARRSGHIAAAQRQHQHRRARARGLRSEEHTSELQSLAYLVCRLLLEKKKTNEST